MIDKANLVEIRDFRESDKHFIFSTFLRGLYYGDSWFSLIPKTVFMTKYHKVLEHIMNSPNTKVSVACLKDDPEVILGYAMLDATGSTLHWVFCKKAWRSIGIAKSLVPDSISNVTHLTKTGKSILSTKPNVQFNPFLI